MTAQPNKEENKCSDCDGCNEGISALVGVLVGVFIIIQGLSLLLAVLIAFSAQNRWVTTCRYPIAKIDYIVPARLLGCWLGDSPMKTKAERDQAND